jgi:hypothetical protein
VFVKGRIFAFDAPTNVTSPVYAYGNKDAISDCESRLRSEYHLSDFRHESAEKTSGESHSYKVTGQTKIEGEKHPFECQINDRHVTSISFDGPEPERMGTAEKLAVGAAAAVAAGMIASKLSKDEEEKPSEAASSPVFSTHTANPSFDCAKVSHDVEKLICQDAEVADLDLVAVNAALNLPAARDFLNRMQPERFRRPRERAHAPP